MGPDVRSRAASGSGRKSGDSVELLPGRSGLIVAHHGVAVEVLFSSGEREMVRVKRRSGHVVGDDVLVRDEVLERLPRRTELRRRDAMRGVHLVGANLDVLGIVVAASPLPPAGFIDRAIVAARAADLNPFLVINKCDLDVAADSVAAMQGVYAGSVAVFPLSAATKAGLVPLQAFLGAGHRGAFVGTTGVGKSSLLNALCPEIDLKVGALNVLNYKGCNTTTVSTLHALPDGGELVDTPGFQDFGLVDITMQDLAAHYPGFEETRQVSCRFRNCRHRSEPGCAVIDLVAQGRISGERYATYLDILNEVESGELETRQRGWKN
ncbi:MAG: ribosome small subunit-dependent GTPase A [Desulfuromonadales bacterium]|nr:ribosome small subunit-dependent GTPase A [Desulfuromonadales bacterium]